MTSSNIMGADEAFSVEGRSFTSIMKSKGPKIYPWRTPCFMTTKLEKIFWVEFDNFISFICFLFVR
jgi:hypothetical protein